MYKIANLNVQILLPISTISTNVAEADVHNTINFCIARRIPYKIVIDAKRYNFFHRGNHRGPIILPGFHNICLNGYHGFFRWINEQGFTS